MLTLGGISLPVPCVVAPMAGVSDLPFRLITRSFGAPLAFTEMIDARALSHRDKRTLRMLRPDEEDHPLGVQLVGNDETYLTKALEILGGYRFEILDLNAACPAAKVTRKGMGAALLRDPARLRGLLRTMAQVSKMPVTVKIRAGWDSASINAREVALHAEDAGISALFIHGRTKTQGYSGAVDYRIIREVKEALRVPVVASGDNLTVESINRMFRETGCDGVAVARGALGNPWIFRELNSFFLDGRMPDRPGAAEIAEVMERHLALMVQHYGERTGLSAFRKFFIWYTKGLSGAKPLRDTAFRAETVEELTDAISRVACLSQRPDRSG